MGLGRPHGASLGGEALCWPGDGYDDEVDDAPDVLDPDDPRIRIDPIRSWVWFQDMADFADRISDDRVWRHLSRALDGQRAFRRFAERIYRESDSVIGAWNDSRNRRRLVRVVEWLRENDRSGVRSVFEGGAA